MKRGMFKNQMALIAVALCAVLLATVGGVVAAAEPKLPPPYRVVQFDVTHSNEVVGKLSVNTNQWTYVLNAHGLQSGTQYRLYCRGTSPLISTETADDNGDLHMEGAWDQPAVNIITPDDSPGPTFFLASGMMSGGHCKATRIVDTEYIITIFATHVEGRLEGEFYNYFTGTMWGNLPNQPVTIYWWDKRDHRYELWATPTTDSNGHFGVTKAFMKNLHTPQIYYQGGTYDGNPYCASYYVP